MGSVSFVHCITPTVETRLCLLLLLVVWSLVRPSITTKNQRNEWMEGRGLGCSRRRAGPTRNALQHCPVDGIPAAAAVVTARWVGWYFNF